MISLTDRLIVLYGLTVPPVARGFGRKQNEESQFMIRNLKILIAAAMALAALGAISASGAQAAELHCGVEPCTVTVKPDGTPGVAGKTAHQVFIVKQGATSVSTTCQQVSGHYQSASKTFKTVTLNTVVYSGCDIAGSSSTVTMNGCEYHFLAPGVAPHDATAEVKCPTGKEIEIKAVSGCVIKIGNTGVLGGGLKFHDAETSVKKEILTAETTVTGIPATVAAAGCPGLALGAATGEYTTGNVELTGENIAGTMVPLWWE
jgi:hypothetical protein